jgi:sulfhydrogenase subunit beta (sulfur reductase)
MAGYYKLDKEVWDGALAGILSTYRVFAPLKGVKTTDYECIGEAHIPDIVYNHPKPVIPLKTFFIPIKENVVADTAGIHPTIIIGIPGCDLAALDLLDQFYLDKAYPDNHYASRRTHTILVGADCYSTETHCHCTSYGLNPYPEKHHDLSVNLLNGHVWLSSNSEKGAHLLSGILDSVSFESMDEMPLEIQHLRQQQKRELEKRNKRLPNYQESTDAVVNSEASVWHSYSRTCVSCGACATICPTCTCFLLIDRPGFEKVRQLDACQYPGFERTAGGEDPLKRLDNRFKNRYLCKYLYRPEKYEAIACTGCGRCIDACIGKINKNELLVELTK